jgi:DNA-binding response OmpR family regulator
MAPLIMVVDDEESVRMVVSFTLEKAGYRVIDADCGDEALNAVEDNPPDLILLDLMMPNIDGWEVLQLLKSNPKTEGIPVCLLTAKGDIRNKMYALQQGAVDYITKPFKREELLEKVKTIVGN